MTHKPSSDVLLGELASVLVEHAGLLCIPAVECDDNGHVTLTILIAPTDQITVGGAMATLELYQQLARVVDVGTMRALSSRYGIDPQAMEALLPPDTEQS